MHPAFAFFPWSYIDTPLTIGPLRLLPYAKNYRPGDLPNISQADMDGIFATYADRPGKVVTRGVIMELGEWQAGMPACQEQAEALLETRFLVAVAALSKRELFYRNRRYINADACLLKVQRYKPGSTEHFAFSTRRRDGGTTYLWSNDMFAFQRPEHVDSASKLELDEALLAALLQLPDAHEHVIDALSEFVLANTDSSDIPEHVEAVMMKSAIERLLALDSSRGAFLTQLTARLADIEVEPCTGPLAEKWTKTWPKAKRPLMAWVMDFCKLRGTSAHGMAKPSTVWGVKQHLAFVSIFFPVLLKKVLADDGLYTLTDLDTGRLQLLEQYVSHDPFDFDWFSNDERDHPWADLNSEARLRHLGKLLYKDLE